MIIVKAVELRKNLKQILEKIYNGTEEDIVLDYYGKLFQITPIENIKTKKKTQAQRVIDHFKNIKPVKLTDPIFNEADPAQEKANFRNLMASRYDK
jgi:hypothetical protein